MRVIDKLENNPLYPKPPAALAKLKKAVPGFQLALVNAKGRDKEMVAIKNKIKDVILTLLQELAVYVTRISRGDRRMILSSGFDTNREPRKIWDEPSIEQLEVTLGGPGIATIEAKNVKGVKAYIHQYTTEEPGPNTIWNSDGRVIKKYTFKNLKSEKRYWFRIVGIGTRKRQGYSPIVSVVIQ
jgi:hypothetical protein